MADEKEIRRITPFQVFILIFMLGEFSLLFALVIYCVAGNLLSIMQQYLLRRIS